MMKRRKEPPAPAKNLSPAPLPRNAAGFGKTWIGDTLYFTDGTNEIFIPKAVRDFTKQRR